MQALSYRIEPRFSETDALGHISHTFLPVWFEQARTPLFRLFNPELSLDTWNLILKNISVDYRAQIYMTAPVDIETWVSRIGNSSFVVVHEAHQNGQVVARGEVVMIYFDYRQQTKADIPAPIRKSLSAHLVE